MAQSVEIKKKEGKPPAVVTTATRALAWIMNLRIVRAFQRYGMVRGAQMSGGIAYSALFTIAGALTIGLTAFSYTLGGNAKLREGLFASIDSALPGVLITADNPNALLDPNDLIVDDPFNLATFIALLVFLWSSIGLMGGLAMTIQSMFGIVAVPRNPVATKLLNLSGFIVLCLGVLSTTVLVSLTRLFSDWLFGFLGISGAVGAFFVTAGSYLVAFVIDAAVVIYLIRVMSGVRAPAKDLLIGGAVAALGSGILRYLGTSAVGSVTNNPLLAGFAAIVTILLWINFLARLLLVAACVTANPPAPSGPTPSQLEHLEESPNYVTESEPDTKRWVHDPRSGIIAPDPPEPEAEAAPEWSGWKAARARKRIVAAEQAKVEAEAQLAIAEDAYRRGAWDAFYARTRYTTNAKNAAVKRGDVVIKDKS
ncbi:YihY/virulence factor BrkB family protein [Trueperella pecoris]|uniref:YihY/virulence factor BrkB family protein n=1 Tax=Trueperella pecoris TaxID=2733571 RepID=A0A7M1QYU6_9ACTO|nr:YihY/virulence factor BrkB family protein [Trueperella pecoris]QOR47063.1 YihY/virulence factor BrkB family protein [Trueperella pecoris]